VSWDGSRIMGAGAAALGAATVILAWGLPEGTATGGPGTRFLPILLGALMVLLGGMVVLGRAPCARAAAASGPEREGEGPGRALATVGIMGAYALVLDRVGFLVATVVLVGVLVRLYGERRWAVVLSVALGAATASYALFAVWLKVPLPPGMLAP
jgi:putative tricarboxylic transport membrane protein